MRKIEAVTFDAGGTLIEPWPSVGAVYAQVALEFGITSHPERLTAQFGAAWNERTGFRYTRAEWAEVVKMSFRGISEISDELFEAIYQRFAKPESWLIYDDVIPTLQALEKLGLKLAVISNWDERLGPLLHQLGLATYFHHLSVSSLVGSHKPDSRIFKTTIDVLGVRPDAALHIGDSLREDVEGARGAGLKAIRIRRSGPEEQFDVLKLSAILELVRD